MGLYFTFLLTAVDEMNLKLSYGEVLLTCTATCLEEINLIFSLSIITICKGSVITVACMEVRTKMMLSIGISN